MKITRATRDDVPKINAILNHSIKTDTANWSHDPRSLDDAYAWFDHHQGKACYPIYVMWDNDEVVGYGALSPFRSNQGYWPIAENSLYVKEGYQYKGIGKALMIKLIEDAKISGLWVITAWIDSRNTESIRFHKAFGFYTVGEMKDIGEKWNKSCSVTIMQLDIKKVEKEHDGKASNVCKEADR